MQLGELKLLRVGITSSCSTGYLTFNTHDELLVKFALFDAGLELASVS